MSNMKKENRKLNNTPVSGNIFFNSLFSIYAAKRFMALLLIVGFLTPLVFIASASKIYAFENRPQAVTHKEARQVRTAPLIFSDSPSLFLNSFGGLFSSLVNQAGNLLAGAARPESVIVNAPTGNEGIFPLASMVFSFVAPKTEAIAPPLPQPSANVDFDFDGDGKTDISRWQPSSTEWRLRNSNGGSVTNVNIGTSGAVIVPGDYDGDDKTDRAVFNSGSWTIKKSSDGVVITPSWGMSGDVPVPGDYDGDDITDLAILRPSTNTWWIYFSSTNSYTYASFGSSGDIPVQADYDGDGKADIAVYRPSGGNWYVLGSQIGFGVWQWGISTDTPVPADYDADGKTDFAVYRPSTGEWWVFKSSTSSYTATVWGSYGDQPVPGDYDGDSKADLAVWRPTNSVWYILRSSDATSEYHSMGTIGDVAVPSAYVKKIGGQAFSYDLAKARLSPKNSTGGTNLYSRNFSWGANLVNLPGRAGLDSNLGIAYNSLVWTKQGSNIYFDTDYSNVSPGFRLGFSVIEPVYYDAATQKFNYLMVTSSGGRIEFRQTGVSNVYETADSSYLQLTTSGASSPNDPAENISIVVKGTDGKQMSFTWKGGAFRCSRVTDRNGNYVTIDHDVYGVLRKITDTLGREINVNYDSELYPTSITQNWKAANGSGSNVTHTYATFTYTTMSVSTDFDGLAVYGPPNGSVLKVLQKVTYANDSHTDFEYNGYAQVKKIINFAPNNDAVNYVKTNLDSPAADQTDCPRFSQTKQWAANFNSGNEVVINNTIQTGHSPVDINGATVTATIIQAATANHPNGNITNTYVYSSGWMEGLPLRVDDYANGNGVELKRTSLTRWTQDNENAAYLTNPRVTETKIADSVNTRRTTLEYYTTGGGVYPFGLISAVKVYDSDQSTILKKIETDYNLSTTYTSRRIIGLPSEVRMYGYENSSLPLVSKVTYGFDEGNFSDSGLEQTITPVQHDTQYGASFIAGRGNMTSVTRYDALGQSSPVTSSMKYNTAGAVVAKIDPLSRTIKFGYADSWNDSASRTTYAYPTSIIDSASNTSTVKYRYDTGFNVEANSPAPAGNSYGKTSKRIYDDKGRLERNSVYVGNTEHSYVRYTYPANGLQSLTYSPIIDIDGDGDIAEDEVLTEMWSDGAGQVIKSRTEHPGSVGGYTGTLIEYDLAGRTKRQSVPTEINSAWSPVGDDATRGFVWQEQEYDWKGRVTRTVNPDGTDKLFSYQGCGCAGEQISTMKSEEVPVPGQSYSARRIQKAYEDSLGRVYKVEVMNWDGTSVYSTSTSEFNGRDQVVQSREHAESSNINQDTVSTFDGHGRLKTIHLPQQSTNAVTSYTYNADDSLHIKTDGRGATTTATYNNLGLISEMDYELPGAAQPAKTNYALYTNGSNTSASSQHSSGSFPAWSAIDGNRRGANWGNNDGWNDNTLGSYPDWLQVNFSGTKTIDEIKVYTLQDNFTTAPEPDETTTFNNEGMQAFDVQYWNGTTWLTVPNGSVTGNNKVVRKFEFSAITTSKIRVIVYAALNYYSRIIELEAWGPEAPSPINSETTFSYDALGNRTSMTDELGSVQYEYNALSQMTSETRAFNDSLPNAPLSGNRFKLEYEYNLSGGLKSLTDPYGQEINYAYDRTGRLDEVTGNTFGGVTTYADNAQYTAWNGLKGLSYGNGVTQTTTFNNRLQANHFELEKGSVEIMKKNYQYINDGRLKYAQDQLNDKFDRLNIYDHVGRIKEAKTGLEARGGTVTTNQNTDLPYRQSYQFNEFNNMTARNNLHWGVDYWYGVSNNLSYTYQNNRVTNSGWQYDADGRVTVTSMPEDYALSVYDARGLLINHHVTDPNNSTTNTQRFYDGDGRESKRKKFVYTEDLQATTYPYGSWAEHDSTYYIRSTVLKGQVVSETYNLGQKKKTYVIAGGARIATQSQYSWSGAGNQAVSFEHYDASGMSYRSTTADGTVIADEGAYEGAPAEFDPLGGNVGLSTPYIEIIQPPPPPGPDFPFFPMDGGSTMYVNGRQVQCTVDGMAIGCNQAMSMLDNGSAIPAALAPYQHLPGFNFQNHGLGIYTFTLPLQVGWHVNPDRTVTPVYSQSSTRTYSFAIPTNTGWQQQQPRALTQDERDDFNEGRDRARQELRNNERCRNAIKAILDRVGTSLLPDQTLTFRDGTSVTFNNMTNFVYDSTSRSSRFLDQYDSVTMQASGRSGRSGNTTTFGTTNRTSINGIFIEGPIAWNREFFNLGNDARALHILHEILHQYANDIDIANAIANITNDRPDGRNNPVRTFTDAGAASEYINEYLRTQCNLPTQ